MNSRDVTTKKPPKTKQENPQKILHSILRSWEMQGSHYMLQSIRHPVSSPDSSREATTFVPCYPEVVTRWGQPAAGRAEPTCERPTCSSREKRSALHQMAAACDYQAAPYKKQSRLPGSCWWKDIFKNEVFSSKGNRAWTIILPLDIFQGSWIFPVSPTRVNGRTLPLLF